MNRGLSSRSALKWIIQDANQLQCRGLCHYNDLLLEYNTVTHSWKVNSIFQQFLAFCVKLFYNAWYVSGFFMSQIFQLLLSGNKCWKMGRRKNQGNLDCRKKKERVAFHRGASLLAKEIFRYQWIFWRNFMDHQNYKGFYRTFKDNL